ncbi:MAG: metal-sensitive transcriptional regulator [Bifidobacterium sp.]|nr:metal-sensitive transcriptional regulator [Bifidobacterium sp.]
MSEKDRYTRRLRRIEGQVRGITRMVDEEEYCINILTQISATTGALHAVALNLLEDHLGHCVFNSAATNPLDAQKRLTEAANAIGRLLKS